MNTPPYTNSPISPASIGTPLILALAAKKAVSAVRLHSAGVLMTPTVMRTIEDASNVYAGARKTLAGYFANPTGPSTPMALLALSRPVKANMMSPSPIRPETGFHPALMQSRLPAIGPQERLALLTLLRD